MIMKSTQALMECLLEQGVDTVFGYPGGTILNIYDEFERNGYGKKIRHILTTHEQGASHAADGYARATGKVGVCFATSGTGATNLTTGIAVAQGRGVVLLCAFRAGVRIFEYTPLQVKQAVVGYGRAEK
ncbi:MAG TPA: crossover junction endodeoxyribonuclease RuvC, partial [Oscillospiraceae bacterium]|nr:crossover junction endodeoxyribonuclease RuvC [Oscillospiraceae bacterium]